MDENYAETIAKYGLFFMHPKHMDRLNFDDTSLVREKWTTELCDREVEVMPIIFESDEYKKQVEAEKQSAGTSYAHTNPGTSLTSFTYTETTCQKTSGGETWWISLYDNVQSDNSQTSVEIAVNPNDDSEISTLKSAGGEAWWISLNDNDETRRLKAHSSESFNCSLFNLRARLHLPIRTRTDFEEIYSCQPSTTPTESDDDVEVLFQRSDESNSEEVNVIYDIAVVSPRIENFRRVSSAPSYLQHFNQESEELYSSAEESEISLSGGTSGYSSITGTLSRESTSTAGSKPPRRLFELMKTIVSDLPSFDESSHTLTSRRISRPLSSRYSYEVKGKLPIRGLNRTKSVMNFSEYQEVKTKETSFVTDERILSVVGNQNALETAVKADKFSCSQANDDPSLHFDNNNCASELLEAESME